MNLIFLKRIFASGYFDNEHNKNNSAPVQPEKLFSSSGFPLFFLYHGFPG